MSEQEHDWHIATIQTQSHGPKYFIDSNDNWWDAVDTIIINGAKVNFEKMLELEYAEFKFENRDYPENRTVIFTAPHEEKSD